MQATPEQEAWAAGHDAATTDTQRATNLGQPGWFRADAELPMHGELRRAWLLGYCAGILQALAPPAQQPGD